ncbi:MAG: D-alanine--D-alanine ligase family protein [Clostridiales bacterium]
MKIQIGIFFGGKSVEHEVSVITAAQTAAAMDAAKYELIPVYITKDNEMYTGAELFDVVKYKDLPGLLSRSQRILLLREKGKIQLLRYPAKLFAQPFIAQLDLAFPIVHGTNVEDGSLQGYFQLHGLPYIGSDVGASACGMDKWVTKCLLQGAGLPVLPGYCFQSSYYYGDPQRIISKLEELYGYPLMVKPVNLGSSVGISAAHDPEELKESIELAASFSDRILAEPMLTNMREINCAVMGDSDYTEASACEEPLSTGEILSYQDKYQGGGKSRAAVPKSSGGGKGMGGSLRKLPADLDIEQEEEIKILAQKAFLALNCNGVIRVDFLLDQEENQIYINEVNTIPGSLAFYLWEAAGKPFRQLTEELVQLALKRQRAQERLIWSNEVNILSGMQWGTKGVKQ